MRKSLVLMLALLGIPFTASAQINPTGTISTAGSDCSTSTNCVGWSAFDLESFGVYINVGTSGTFVYEVSQDATALTNGTWAAIDDADGNASATADGAYYFANSGFLMFRIRASAISGAATVIQARGYGGSAGGNSASVSGDVTITGGDGVPVCEIGSCDTVTSARPVVEVDPDTGAPVTYGTVWTLDIPFDSEFDAPGLLLRGKTAPVDQASVDDSLVAANADQYGSLRILPSIGGVDLTATSTSLNVNQTNPCRCGGAIGCGWQHGNGWRECHDQRGCAWVGVDAPVGSVFRRGEAVFHGRHYVSRDDRDHTVAVRVRQLLAHLRDQSGDDRREQRQLG